MAPLGPEARAVPVVVVATVARRPLPLTLVSPLVLVVAVVRAEVVVQEELPQISQRPAMAETVAGVATAVPAAGP
jgi:hypothetical protein